MSFWYANLWTGADREVPQTRVLFLLFALSVLIPALVGYGVLNPNIAKATFILVAGILGLLFFFNVRAFVAYVIPLFYIILIHHSLYIFFALLLIAFAAEKAYSGDLSLKIPYPILLIAILLSGFLGMNRAMDPGLGRYFFIFSLVLPVVFFMVIYNLNPSTLDMKRHLTVIAVVTAIVGWVSLAMWIQTKIPRQVFRWDSQNPAGCFMGMLLPFTLISLIDAKDRWERFLWVIIFGGVMAATLVTQTRAVLVSLFVAIMYISFADRRVLKVMLPVILIASIALPGLIIQRIALLFGHGAVPDWSSVGRVEIWMNSITYIPKYYLFGMGIGSFEHLYRADFPSSFLKAEHPHNAYLRWLLEYGIVGMISHITIIFLAFRKALKALKIHSGNLRLPEERLLLALNAGMISALVASMVDATLHNAQLALFLWTIMAFQLVISNRLQKEASVEIGSVRTLTGMIPETNSGK